MVFRECYQLLPLGGPPDTAVVFSHPMGGGAYLPMVTELARCGNHVIYANSRYRGNDSALIMEKVVLDLAAAVRYARERQDRKSTRLNSSHSQISYAVFCLKKKNQ